MDQKLIKQVKNEWRSNLWLMVELAVISVVLWYIIDYLFVIGSVYNQPRGFDISHCYRISVGNLTEQHPEYIADRKAEEIYMDYEELRRRIELRPEVEAAALSMNSTPYNGSNSGVTYMVDSILSVVKKLYHDVQRTVKIVTERIYVKRFLYCFLFHIFCKGTKYY